MTILYKQAFKFKKNATVSKVYKSFELAYYSMKYSPHKLQLVIVYRPPPSTKNGSTPNLFFEEFSRFSETFLTNPDQLIICGGLNFHVDSTRYPVAVKFLNLLDTFNLEQHIKEETHKNGHTLDLVIPTSDDKDFIPHVSVTEPAISGYYSVLCKISISKPCYLRRETNYRKLRSTDDISNSSLTDAANTENVTGLT